MDLRSLEFSWKEYYIKYPNNRETYLTDMLKSLKGEKKVGGRNALQFSSLNEEDGLIFISVEFDPATNFNYCLKWNDDKEKWEILGILLPTNEWGLRLFSYYWSSCAIGLYSSSTIVHLKDTIAGCFGEKYGGLLFKGKGIWDGEMLILKLDREEKLQNYYEDQKCYRYDNDSGEWEFFGMLLKNPNKKP